MHAQANPDRSTPKDFITNYCLIRRDDPSRLMAYSLPESFHGGSNSVHLLGDQFVKVHADHVTVTSPDGKTEIVAKVHRSPALSPLDDPAFHEFERGSILPREEEVVVPMKDDSQKRAFAWSARTRQWRPATPADLESAKKNDQLEMKSGSLILEGDRWLLKHRDKADRRLRFQFDESPLRQLPPAGLIPPAAEVKTVRFLPPWRSDPEDRKETDSFYFEMPGDNALAFPAWTCPCRALWFERREK